MKILLTGAHGNLGTQLNVVFASAGHGVLGTEREDLDITDREAVLAFVAEQKPDAIVNAAAYNFVDKVEEPDVYPLAYAVNALGPKHLAEAAKQAGIPFVHYSTDYVFAGEKLEGYAEDDATGPINAYGKTKEAGEKFVQEIGGRYYICRLSKLFGARGTSEASKPAFAEVMLTLAKTKPELRIVDEEVGMPTYVNDIADRTLWMLTHDAAPGVYHVVNEGPGVTWYQFAEEIFSVAPSTTPRIPVSSTEFPRPAPRPKFAPLRNTKLLPLRSRRDALAEYIATLA